MTKAAKLILIGLGVVVLASICAILTSITGNGLSSEETRPILSVEANPKISRSCVYSNDGKRCVVINRLACPPGWGPQGSSDDEELEECSDALEGIKKWCDPNCQENLEECLVEVQRVREECYTIWSVAPEIYF